MAQLTKSSPRVDLSASWPVDQHLLRIVSLRAPAELSGWLAFAIGTFRTAAKVEGFFEDARVMLGEELVWLSPEERWALERDGGPASMVGWGLDTCARVAVILRVRDELRAEEHAAMIARIARSTDRRGRCAIERALALLPYPAPVARALRR